jgi:hypothetical protein
MASFRRKYQIESPAKDGPPVMTMPNETAAQAPPAVADAPKPPEPPVAEPGPADEAAKEKIALRLRLQEMERAENLQREAVSQHPQFAAEPQESQQPTTEEIIAASGLPERAKAWLRQYPEYVSDPIKNAQMQKMHNVAEYQAGSEFTERYFDRMEILLGLRQEPTPAPVVAPPDHPRLREDRGQATAPRNSAPVRKQQYAAPVSAPPTREPPSMVTGRSRSFRQPLTTDELHIAQQCGQTPEQYQEQKEKMQRLKAAGAIQDGR